MGSYVAGENKLSREIKTKTGSGTSIVFENQAFQGSRSPKVRLELASGISKAPLIYVPSHKIVRLELLERCMPQRGGFMEE